MGVQPGPYTQGAAARSQDVSIRKLLGDLAAAETQHGDRADDLVERGIGASEKQSEAEASRRSLLLFYLAWARHRVRRGE